MTLCLQGWGVSWDMGLEGPQEDQAATGMRPRGPEGRSAAAAPSCIPSSPPSAATASCASGSSCSPAARPVSGGRSGLLSCWRKNAVYSLCKLPGAHAALQRCSEPLAGSLWFFPSLPLSILVLSLALQGTASRSGSRQDAKGSGCRGVEQPAMSCGWGQPP